MQQPEKTDIISFMEGCKPHHAYQVNVCFHRNNPVHRAILFTGFDSGSYWKVYTNSYDHPQDMKGVWFIEIVKELCSLHEEDRGEGL